MLNSIEGEMAGTQSDPEGGILQSREEGHS